MTLHLESVESVSEGQGELLAEVPRSTNGNQKRLRVDDLHWGPRPTTDS